MVDRRNGRIQFPRIFGRIGDASPRPTITTVLFKIKGTMMTIHHVANLMNTNGHKASSSSAPFDRSMLSVVPSP
jgi:hypothetical protein